VQDWILRSQPLPLTLHIDVDRINVLPPLLDTISQCSDRLQSLSLHIPRPILQAFQHSNLQWHRLRRLRIISSSIRIESTFVIIEPDGEPRKDQIDGVPFHSLQISWNHLISANVSSFDVEEVFQLFQHASQMTDCRISSLRCGPESFSIPPITHDRLKVLRFSRPFYWSLVPILLGSLTLPCLEEFHTDELADGTSPTPCAPVILSFDEIHIPPRFSMGTMQTSMIYSLCMG
jgi:hypothetical protein